VRRRILVAIVAITAIAVVLFAVPLAFAVANLYHNEEIVRLEREAAAAAQHVPAEFPTSVDTVELPRGTSTRVFALYDRSGRRLAGTGPRRADAATRAAFHGSVHDDTTAGSLIAAVPLTRGEQVVGVIRAAAPASLVDDRTRNAILLMAAIGTGVIAVSAAIAAWQARRLARPVAALARTATALGHGDFTVRSDTTGVAEVDALSDALNRTAEQLDRMLSRERSFSEDASHQLRTALTGLRLTLEAARLDPSIEREAALRDAAAQVDRLDATIDDLLALAREPAGRRAPLVVDPLVDELEATWHARLAAGGRPLRVIVHDNLPATAAAPAAVRQILDVLLDNATRHGAGAVTIETRPAAGGVAIDVRDEGPGVAGDPDRLFERRHRDTARHHGIGLALARSLAEADGGKLQITHARPGPVFSLFLSPAHHDPPADGAAGEAPDEPGTGSAATRRRTGGRAARRVRWRDR
jgi:signal transduction histidine kinase